MKDFKDRVAVITGAASGIGHGLAEHAAKEGMKVVLADIEKPVLEKAANALHADGADVLAVMTDVSRYEDVENLARQTVKTFGSVHLLFNNAGVQAGKGTMFWEDTLNDWRWVLGVNLWGVIHGIKAFLPVMLENKEPGHIVNTSSVSGLMASGAMGIYSTSKAAIITLSESLYLQLKQAGKSIGVTVLCPSEVRSGLNDAERNRPLDLKNSSAGPLTPQQESIVKLFEQLNEKGMPPDEFARLVFDAIRDERLYVLSHPAYTPMVKQRMDNIIQGTNPS